MITQYTRLVIDSVIGDIKHCTSQDFPFTDGWQPIDDPSITPVYYDFEMDTDFVDADYGIGRNQEMIRSRQILENFEIIADQPVLKSGAASEVADKILRISATKSIEETDIKTEMAASIRADLDGGGSSEKELLDEMRLVDKTTPDKIEDLTMLKVIRIYKAL